MTDRLDRDPVLSWAVGHDMDVLATTSPREAIERQLSRTAPETIVATLDLWRRATAGVVTEEAMCTVALNLGADSWDPPDGSSWLVWTAWYVERLREALEEPATVLPRGALPTWPYPWRVHDSAAGTAESLHRAARVLRELHRERERAWLADPAGGSRLHLAGDVGAVVGQLVLLDPEGDGRAVLDGVDSTRAAVVLHRLDAGDAGTTAEVHAVHATDPSEDPRAAGWRVRWPALVSFLGGWFNAADLADTPCYEEDEALIAEAPAFLDRVADELDGLLLLDDADLRAAVAALGCYAEPPHLRRWLGWTSWRIRRFDWA
ncbi:hypothetical protein GCM10027586_20300 [Kineococcus gypseus]